MIIVTGGAGFIGSAIVGRLNELGYDDILVVDELGESPKWRNLNGKKYSDYLHKTAFLETLKILGPEVQTVFHMGACSSTTERNLDFLIENNYRYSRILADWCFQKQIRFLYASSAATYGDGSSGFSDDHNQFHVLRPLNPYGYSKHLFDLWLLQNRPGVSYAGFKFFNVFGPNEYHKDDMASVVFKAYHQIGSTNEVRLFKSYRSDYADGEQKRDFVYIKDCVDVMMWFQENRDANGIFNLGTGQARSWNDLVRAIFRAMKKPDQITYIDMPESIRNAYQYFTQADARKLAASGCPVKFRSLEDAVRDYVVNYLEGDRYL